MNTSETTVDTRPTCDVGPFRFYKPPMARLLFALFMIGVCVALGGWQLQRLQWKEALIAEVEIAQTSSKFYIDTLPDELDELREKNFYPIMLPGEFVHEHEMHMIGRSLSGEPGFNVYTPFRIADNGRMVLVNRGWIPQNKKELANRPEDDQFGGTIFVNGFISATQGGSMFLPDHDVKGNVWFWPDIERINAEKNLDMPHFTIEVVNADPVPGKLPIPRVDYEIEFRNDHFNYAMMWFSMAFAGLVIFFIYHLKSVKGDEGHDSTPKP